MRHNCKNPDDAVSPVIGVMLMLVVTIIIAAIVSGFAGSLTGTQEKVPQASLAVKTGYGVKDDGSIDKTIFDISIEHLGGDPINTKNCQLITYLTLPNGTIVRHVQSATSPLGRGNGVMYSRGPHLYDHQQWGYPCNAQTDATVGGVTIPGFNPAGGTGLTYENKAWFGNAVWTPGCIARSYRDTMTSVLLGLAPGWNPVTQPSDTSDYTTAVDLLNQCISNQTQLEVKLLHVPTGKYILDKTVMLQG